MRIQFLLKKREVYTGDYCTLLQSGLYNSARFLANKLAEFWEVDVIDVVDNNCIDREVTRFKPDVVVIEALWVVPEKMGVLVKLHPTVTWIVRLHSRIPFLATEGQAMDWIQKYQEYPGVFVASNVGDTAGHLDIISRPNYYPIADDIKQRKVDSKKTTVDIGCFGAIRPLKNQLIQAFAASRFADSIGKELRFHINGSRPETGGEPVLKNLRAFLGNRLVEHEWLPHDEFLKLVASMDYGLQVSYSESFNIVAADFVSQGIPVITSDQIEWNSPTRHADPNSVDSIVKKMKSIGNMREKYSFWMDGAPHERLREYNIRSIQKWVGTEMLTMLDGD